VTFNVWTFLFEVLNFLVLALILHRLLYRPLRAAIDERRAANEKAKTEAEAARKAAETARSQLTAKLAEVDRERTDVLRTAAQQAEIERVKRLAVANAAAKTVREQAQHEAAQLRHDTIAGLEGEVGQLAIGLAERLLTQACNAALNEQLIHRLVEVLRGVTDAEREQVCRDAGTGEVRIESATALTNTTRAELTAAVRELLGRECAPKVEIRPALIGGALVCVGGHVWDATLAAQLDAAKVAVNGNSDGKPG
jgi:F-type H+-transporting ATPase subunit b